MCIDSAEVTVFVSSSLLSRPWALLYQGEIGLRPLRRQCRSVLHESRLIVSDNFSVYAIRRTSRFGVIKVKWAVSSMPPYSTVIDSRSPRYRRTDSSVNQMKTPWKEARHRKSWLRTQCSNTRVVTPSSVRTRLGYDGDECFGFSTISSSWGSRCFFRFRSENNVLVNVRHWLTTTTGRIIIKTILTFRYYCTFDNNQHFWNHRSR